jgi:hypothetical protein
MTDKPIIFSAPMVRALLDGRKTQTRRVVKNVPDAPAMDNIAWPDKKLHPAPYVDAYCGARRTPENPRGMTENWAYWTRDDRPGPPFKVGYVPGDRLWVREAHTFQGQAEGECLYRATVGDDTDYYVEEIAELRWRPSIHMPRWASRLTLTVTDVRVQRLQDISGWDVEAEGACEFAALPPNDQDTEEARAIFRDLWNSLHGSDAWAANPWVCALTFTVKKGNIDA